MEPPTPQSTTLTTKTVIPPIAVPASASPHDSTAESDTGPSGGVSDRSTELHKQRLERRKRKKRHPPDARGMTSSCRFLSTLVTSRNVVAGPVAAGGHQLHSSSESLMQAPAAQLPAAAPDSVRSFGSMTGRSLKQTRSSSVTSARRSESLTHTCSCCDVTAHRCCRCAPRQRRHQGRGHLGAGRGDRQGGRVVRNRRADASQTG